MTDRLAEIRAVLAGATPGPWLLSGEWIIRAEDEQKDGLEVVPVVGLWDGGDLRMKADDARLIAAAPELLAWCVDTIETLERGLSAATDGLNEQAREIERLRKLFDDAGQGEHNVLALIDYYQAEAMKADAEAERLRGVLVSAVDDLSEHVGDGCAGPSGTARRGACRDCALAEFLRTAIAKHNGGDTP